MNIRKYLPGIILFTILGIMALTNPGEEKFKEFVKKQLLQHKFTERDIENTLLFQKPTNYIIFSNFEFQVKDSGVLMQGKYLGVFGVFYSLGGYAPDGTE